MVDNNLIINTCNVLLSSNISHHVPNTPIHTIQEWSKICSIVRQSFPPLANPYIHLMFNNKVKVRALLDPGNQAANVINEALATKK
jgi:hypothetical protein